VFASTRTRTALLGVTEQLIGEPWLHAAPFRYAGSIGPIPNVWDAHGELTLLGWRLVITTGIRGVWGVDFISHIGEPWVVEVNPRYTASLEVIEHGRGISAFAEGSFAPAKPLVASRGRSGVMGKAIYFAPHRITFPASGPWDADLAGDFDPWRLPGFADIPDPGEVVEPGRPVLTFFAAAPTPAGCRERLQSRAAELDVLFNRES
jgi:predicted ATP-grasp superfamily ATP-dependent carboligase